MNDSGIEQYGRSSLVWVVGTAVIEGNASITKDLTVDITSTGTVTVNGANIGSVTLQPTTGGVSQ